MASLRSAVRLPVAAALLAVALALFQPSPPSARANAACDVGVAPAAPITDKLGIGNPLGDACNALTDPVLGVAGKALDPLREAAGALGQGIFAQITTWVSDGAVWLLGEVTELSERTTSPDLLGKGFLRRYRQMALIAALMAALMLLLAVFEALARGEAGMLWRAFLITAPLAAIATSAAYVLVQLLIATDDGLCEAIAQSSGADAKHFFKGAIQALAEIGAAGGAAAGTAASGPGVGTAAGAAGAAGGGAVEVPLFVGFIAAVLAAFAAFFVWIELLMRGAAIYVVALFMPLAIAASIWPRWASALRRSCELVVVIVFSKFVIVAIVSLAASLLAQSGGRIEQVLAAGAMLLLACFSPFVLFKLVPFAESALSAAYNRQSASGGALRGVEHVTSVQMMRRAALSNWGLEGAGATGTGTGKGGGRGGGGSKRGSPAGGGPAGGAAAPSAEAGAGAAAAPLATAAAAKKAGHEAAGGLAESGASDAASGTAEASGAAALAEGGMQSGGQRASRPRPDGAAPEPDSGCQLGGAAPEPSEASGGKTPGGKSKPPRPAAEPGPAPKEAKP
ncbi:MAG TPA: hypothetical protein VHQ43_01180 [Solirubrobacterales bacterium]|jgi:hypothetical protein|nr:hypothetical protein [Solirubrobacterales bacterium]